jgi:threonine dehydratase
VVWIMERLKLVAEGAAAAPVAALLQGLVTAPAGAKVGCILSGGNLDLTELQSLRWN